MKKYFLFLLILTAYGTTTAHAVELVIGESTIEPGIVFIFEGAIKDEITPTTLHLKEDKTDVHIEARVNWATEAIPPGTPAGGFVPYLSITAKVVNQKTGLSTFVDLLPHLNLIDNFHYARNISLPGKISDPYAVEFSVIPPPLKDLALHRDWVNRYGSALAKEKIFNYKDVNFEEIARASRR